MKIKWETSDRWYEGDVEDDNINEINKYSTTEY